MSITLVGLITFIINLPMGYWRSRLKKFSFKWFLAVHMAVPFLYFFRSYAGIELHLTTFIVFAGCYLLGQYTGKRIRVFERITKTFINFVLTKTNLNDERL